LPKEKLKSPAGSHLVLKSTNRSPDLFNSASPPERTSFNEKSTPTGDAGVQQIDTIKNQNIMTDGQHSLKLRKWFEVRKVASSTENLY
jgi:hypothetical protein